MPAEGNFFVFIYFLPLTLDTLDLTMSLLPGKGTWCLLHTLLLPQNIMTRLRVQFKKVVSCSFLGMETPLTGHQYVQTFLLMLGYVDHFFFKGFRFKTFEYKS